MRRRPVVKRDTNHQAVVRALRAAGALVVDLASVGNDVPDLLVGAHKRWFLLEVKSRPRPSDGALTPGQATFAAVCASLRLPCYVVTSEAEALDAMRRDR